MCCFEMSYNKNMMLQRKKNVILRQRLEPKLI